MLNSAFDHDNGLTGDVNRQLFPDLAINEPTVLDPPP